VKRRASCSRTASSATTIASCACIGQNAGKLDAWRGTAKLYDLAGGIRAEQPIAESGIKGAGAKVSAGYSGEASYRLVADFPSRFLVCVTYFDGVHFAKRSGELMMRRLLIVV
jgi:hypothetical protein